MDSRPTDAELIRLVQEKLPEELTHAEIRQLHERLQESAELKAVLIGQLHLETYLNTAMAEINLSVDEIVRRAGAIQQTQAVRRWPFWTGLAGLLLLIGLGVYFATSPDPRPQQLAGEPKGPEAEQTENEINTEESPAVAKSEESANGEDDEDPQTQPTDPKTPNETNPDLPNENVAENNSAPAPRGRPTDPWFEDLDPDAAPQPLVQTAYRMPGFAYGKSLRKEDALSWLEKVGGQPFEIREHDHKNDRWVELRGVGRLQAPWVRGAVLRLSLFDTENFRLHFWCGDSGVTLAQYAIRQPHFWAAYRSRRKNDQPVPEELSALLTTDNARQSRVRSGVVEFRYQEGSLVMSQGRVRLLSVPLPNRPEEIILDGRCMLSEVSMYRGEAIPPEAEPARPDVLASTRPADGTWMTHLPGRDLREGLRELGQARENPNRWDETLTKGATFSALDGTVRLAVESSEEPISVARKLNRPGLHEVIFRVDEADAGTAIFFGDEEGREKHRLGFFRDERTGQIVFESARTSDNDFKVDNDPSRVAVAYFTPGHWIRVVWGFGSFKISSSGDGVHWGLIGNPQSNLPGPFSTIGLHIHKTEEPRQIALSHLEIREFSAITSLASQEARQQAPSFGNLKEMDFGAWNERVVSHWPDPRDGERSIPMNDWRRACAIRSLEESPWSPLSATLLRGLLEDGIEMARPLNERFRLLDEVSLLYNLQDGNNAAAMVAMYERLGTTAAREGHADPFGLTLAQLQTAPIWTNSRMEIIRPEFMRGILLHHAFSRDWETLRSVAERTEFLMHSSHPRKIWWWDKDQRAVLEWAMALADSHIPKNRDSEGNWIRQISQGRQWRHPLVTQVSKEGYNVIAEFEAALASDAYEDACRIITSAGRSGMAGLLPDSKDPQLLVSLPRAIAIAMREHPELQETMCEQFCEIGQLRVREAMTRADVEAVEAATVRFYGTSAAAEAYRWLGNRALAGGKFAQAAQAYQEALPFADSSLARDLQNRLRLAAGLLGREIEHEPAGPVQFADASWSESEFDTLVDELKKAHARGKSTATADWNPASSSETPPPAPVPLNAVERNRFGVDLGRGAGRYGERNTDWVARQLAITGDGNSFYVSNRFQVVCYQAEDGKTRWSRGLGEEQGSVRDWPMVSMRPLVVGNRIFVRRLTKRGPELASLSQSNGELLWNVRPEHHVASDPVFVQNRLLALVATMPQSGMLQLELTSFHPETGDVLSQQPVVYLRDEWEGHPPCQILATNGKVLCTIGGTTLCCDPLGQPQWLQQHPWFPPEIDRHSKMQHHQPPIVADGRVYTSQSGVRDVSCFELSTGRQIWSRPMPDIERLVGLAGGCLIVQSDLGLAGFDQISGEERWRHAAPGLLNGIRCGGGRLIYSREIEYSSEGNVCLVWLDPKTGQERSHTVLNSLEGDDLRFGPLVMENGRLWGFAGQGFKEAERKLIELVPDETTPPAGPLHPHALAKWPDDILPRTFANTAAVLPGWTITTTQKDFGKEKGVQLMEEFRGENRVAKTRIRDDREVHFARQIALPASGTAKLKMQVGHDAGEAWTVRVRLGQEVLLEEAIDDKSAPKGWLSREVDLSPWAGRTVWLIVSHTDEGEDNPGDAYWKSLTVELEGDQEK